MSLALNITDLVKAYGSTIALNGASLEVTAGSAHAVIGENGAGKSTLVKVLAGLVRPDRGTVELYGEEVRLTNPRDAFAAGIATAFQELSLVPALTVADNLALPRKPRTRGGVVSNRRTRTDARRKLDEWEVDNIDPGVYVESLSLSAKQKVEIVSAMSRQPRLLILDEPTSALGRADVEWLFRQVGRLRELGTTIIFVSHRLPEVRELCESLTVLRNGRRAGSSPSMDVSDDQIIQMMIGQSLAKTYPPRPARAPADAVALDVQGLAAGRVTDATFHLHSGEVLGVAGLQDHGQRDLFRALFGAHRIESGTVRVGGTPIRLRSPRDAIRAGLGISLVPEERAIEGALLTMSGRANVTLPSLRDFTTLGWVNRKKEAAAVRQVLEDLQIPDRAMYEPVEAFSGGNQQKIVIAKWLLAEARILLLYDPTRGVDIKTKTEIYHLIRRFADSGGAVLFYSTDLEEIVNLCDRAMVCYRGRLSEPIAGGKADNQKLLAMVLGGQLPTEAAA